MKFFKQLFFYFLISYFAIACSKDGTSTIQPSEGNLKELTIFHIND